MFEGINLSEKRGSISKRGQITLFIIIGISIVVLVGIYFMLKSQGTILETENELDLQAEKVGIEFSPIQGYVDNCIYSLSKEAVKKVGLQGGYVDSDVLVANPIDPTEGNANSLVFFPGDDTYKIAYWWYMDAGNRCDEDGACSFNSYRPPLTGPEENSIESQLELYVTQNLDKCIEGFRPFEIQGFEVTENERPEVDITIASKDIVVQLDYPITAVKENRKQDMRKFFVKLPFNIRKMYDFATTLAEGEGAEKYLERQILNLISVFSTTGDRTSLPPMADMTLDAKSGMKIWTRTEVKEMLQDILTNYVPFIQVIESANFQPIEIENEIAQAVFNMMVVSVVEPPGTEYFEDYSVEFDYKKWWEPYVRLGNSEVIKPSSFLPHTDFPLIGSAMALFNVQTYKVAYDVSYPVLVRIYDHDAFNGEGFSWYIAMESNLRNNFPLNETTSDFGTSVVGSIFCNENQRVSGDVILNVKDESGSYIDGVKASYHCGSQTCLLGETKKEAFITKLPSCIGGYMLFTREGYVPTSKNLSVTEGYSESIDIEMLKYRTKKVDVKLFRTERAGSNWAVSGVPRSLSSTEMAMLTLERQGANDGSSNFVAIVRGDDTEEPVFTLVPGKYDVQGTLMLELPAPDRDGGIQNVVIPEDDREECQTIFLFIEDCVEYTLPEIKFEEVFPEGGVYLDDAHGGAWEVTAEQLDNADTITFYLIASPGEDLNNLRHEDLEEIGLIEYYSKQERNTLLEPAIG